MTTLVSSVGAPLVGRARRAADRFRASRRLRGLDACLLSYPKCGRTWLRVMVGTALQAQFGLTWSDPTDIYGISRSLETVPTIHAFHDDNPMWKTIDELETDKRRYRGKRVILLVRDPRDVAVSSYFHHTRRSREFDGDLEAFLVEKRIVEKVCRFYNIWKDQRDRPQAVLLVRYEDMHDDPGRELVRSLRFLGVARPDPAAIEAAVTVGSFDHMHELEASGEVDSHRLTPGSVDDPESYKTRRGVVGGFRQYMTADQIERTTSQIRDGLDPWFGYPPEDDVGSAG